MSDQTDIARLGCRAVHQEPVVLAMDRTLDGDEKVVASFTAVFSFRMKVAAPNQSMGDGMAFIIAGDPDLPLESVGRGPDPLGITDPAYPRGDARNEVVAVEFDTYANKPYDPVDDANHVGFDVNDYASLQTQNLTPFGIALNNSSAEAPILKARIHYDAPGQQLSLYMANYSSAGQGKFALVLSRSDFNLSSYVPSYAYVGFSATSTMGKDSLNSAIQNTYVFDWYLNTTWFYKNGTRLYDHSTDNPYGASSDSESESSVNIWRQLILGVGIALLLATLVLVCGIMISFYHRSSDIRRSWPWRSPVEVLSYLATFCLAIVKDGNDGLQAAELTTSWADAGSYGPRTFTYQELEAATLGFSPCRILGEGGFGTVYRGEMMLPTGLGESHHPSRLGHEMTQLAIKRISQDSRQGEKEFRAELTSLGNLRHKNLVRLLGWCHHRHHLLLVYDLMPNSSLDRHLYSPEAVLSWAHRFRILQGVAAALLYIHTQWERCILHRDIKPSNVMLDAKMRARLGDFGLARLMEDTAQTELSLTHVAGTRGYMPPELLSEGKATARSDVFSFGVVALEVACGRSPQQVLLVEWVWGMHEAGQILAAADEALAGRFDEAQLRCVLHLGLLCTHPDPNSRPDTTRMHHILSGDVEMPPLPRFRPVPGQPRCVPDLHLLTELGDQYSNSGSKSVIVTATSV